jgi:hypothetical protein
MPPSPRCCGALLWPISTQPANARVWPHQMLLPVGRAPPARPGSSSCCAILHPPSTRCRGVDIFGHAYLSAAVTVLFLIEFRQEVDGIARCCFGWGRSLLQARNEEAFQLYILLNEGRGLTVFMIGRAAGITAVSRGRRSRHCRPSPPGSPPTPHPPPPTRHNTLVSDARGVYYSVHACARPITTQK